VERLWSPWRLEYVTRGEAQEGCVFCLPAEAFAKAGEALLPSHPDSLIVHQGTTCYVILNLYPYNNGHLMVVPVRHVATLSALSPEELHEVALLTQRAEAALMEAYTPHGLNVGINLGKPAGAGILEHLHVHLVPRWNGDTNFMTTVGNMRVLPEDLAASAARLRPVFAKLAQAGA
jgi:ATP adenylyltransferase